MSRAEGRENNTYGVAEGGLIERWRDKRAAHRATAKQELERVRKAALRRVINASRQDALARGLTTYEGSACPQHPDNHTRYCSTGHCIECSRERADLRRQRAGTYRGVRRKPRSARVGRAFVIETGLQVAPRPAARR